MVRTAPLAARNCTRPPSVSSVCSALAVAGDGAPGEQAALLQALQD